MIILRDSSEDEFVLNFLRGEIESRRFSEKLYDILRKNEVSDDVVMNADLNNIEQNKIRKQLLGEFRGYGKNLELFENFPVIKSYKFAVANEEDLEKIKYINYSYWDKLSKGTFSPLVAAESIKEGMVVYNVSNEPFLEGIDYLIKGGSFLPCILLTSNYEQYLILEGHSRMTVYGLIKEKFDNVECYILECNENDLKRWNGE